MAKKVANFLINNLLGALNERMIAIADCPISAESMGGLLALVEDGTLASNQAREVLDAMIDAPQRLAKDIADALGFKPTDTGALEALCEEIIAAHPDKVAEIVAGNEKLLNFLTGQLMKAAATKPNPKLATDLFRKKILG